MSQLLAELDPLPPGIRSHLPDDPELARLRELNPKGVPTGSNDCPTCNRTGEFRWWSQGPERQPVTYRCNCSDQIALCLCLLNANIGKVYQRLSWDDVEAELGAKEKVEGYLLRAEAYMDAGMGLILHGEVGAGKTMYATLVLKKLIGMGYGGYFTTFSEMIDVYTGAWYDAEEKARFHRRIKNTEVLVLDDVGREYQGRKQSGLPESTFDEVIRHRVSSGLPTIITSNLDLERLKLGYGGNVFSLLGERSSTYRFEGGDFRRRANDRVNTEIEMGMTRPLVVG